MMVLDKQQNSEVVIDVAMPAEGNLRKKEDEQIEEYQGLKEQLEQMWMVQSRGIPVVIEPLGAVTSKLEE